MIKKYRDWRGWFDGLRSAAMKAGAVSLATNIAAILGSNGVAAMVPTLNDFVLTWKAALFTTTFQFVMHAIGAAAQYIAAKPDPEIKVKETQTEFVSK